MERKIVSRDEWLQARVAHLQREKELTRMRDELSRDRRQLPCVRVETSYEFDGPRGRVSLRELFGDCTQLIVYHFMYGPDWESACKSCSFWADNFERLDIHLAHRDIRLVAISRAPLQTLLAYKERMGWTFDWYSSQGSSFNFDYGVSFTQAQQQSSDANYNFGARHFGGSEAPGISVFERDADDVFHTYSTYSRGLDMMNAAYHYMDLTPKGRNEDMLEFPMSWLRRRDEY